LSLSKLTYTYDLAFRKSLVYFKGDELAASTWLNKYALKDRQGNLLECTPDQMHLRMAIEFEAIEKNYAQRPLSKAKQQQLSLYGQNRKPLTRKRITDYLGEFKYIIPQGSVMASLGNKLHVTSLSNCIVLPKIHDSYGGILYTDQQLAQLFKRRCGVGIDISSLRPSGMFVLNAAGTTSGAVSFMDRFSSTTREVAQNGRRGALMITMDVLHPDIEAFVKSKQDLSRITGANISVRISDAFMKAVAENKPFTLRFPVEEGKAVYSKVVKAAAIWNTLVQSAHQSAEPGVIFWDRQHAYSTSSVYPAFRNVSTNPCSEIAMQGGDSCRLIAVNLVNLVLDPFTPQARFDFAKCYEVVYEAQRMMDDLVDLELLSIERILKKIEQDPEPTNIKQTEIETWRLISDNGKKGRRTGLGFTALGDTFAAMGMAFDSAQALALGEQIMQTKCRAEFDSSIDMAIERGKFAAFQPKIENKSGFVQMLKKEFPDVYRRMMKFGRRNISISTVAPTGTLSILTQTSSGIEPVFMLTYTRRKKVNPQDKGVQVDFTDASGDAWQEFEVYHPRLKQWMAVTGKKDPLQSPYAGSTAAELNWEKRIALQAMIQKYVTHSISSTLNLPADTPVHTVGAIYQRAWQAGLKGITIYREGSRSGVLLAPEERETNKATASLRSAVERPSELKAEVHLFRNGKEQWYALIGLQDGKPYELFTLPKNKSVALPEELKQGWIVREEIGGDVRYHFHYLQGQNKRILLQNLLGKSGDAYAIHTQRISDALSTGVALPEVYRLVEDLPLDNSHIHTWKAGLQRIMSKYIPGGTLAADRLCPTCGDPDGLVYEEGCIKCKSCGYSLCG
jgi:ribonucleoside-diphosphate reductase alpha chain